MGGRDGRIPQKLAGPDLHISDLRAPPWEAGDMAQRLRSFGCSSRGPITKRPLPQTRWMDDKSQHMSLSSGLHMCPVPRTCPYSNMSTQQEYACTDTPNIHCTEIIFMCMILIHLNLFSIFFGIVFELISK